MAHVDAPARKPTQWDKRVSAAYLRILGATQEDCATSVGVSRRTLQRWEDESETWVAARQEAADRWLADLTDAARETVLQSVRAGDATSARWVLERVVDGLQAPATRHEHSGPDGGAIPLRLEVEFVGATPGQAA